MAILTEKKTWKRRQGPFATHRKARTILTPAERANVRLALRVLLRRYYFTRHRLAAAMGMSVNALEKSRQPSRPQTPRLAIIVARVAGCSIDEILTGTWMPPVVCPHCKGTGYALT